LIGFDAEEQCAVAAMLARFLGDGRRLGELVEIRKFDEPGYNGRVVPEPSPCRTRLPVTLYLATCLPFTIAHELAHVSDIAVRRDETLDHMAAEMPRSWHLSHRMSSEYYANRLACAYVGENDVFGAFASDLTGMKTAAAEQDWAHVLIYWSLILGIFHGLGRTDCDPVELLPAGTELPDAVKAGMAAFKPFSVEFFETHGR
jgi:hypothetical protein